MDWFVGCYHLASSIRFWQICSVSLERFCHSVGNGGEMSLIDYPPFFAATVSWSPDCQAIHFNPVNGMIWKYTHPTAQSQGHKGSVEAIAGPYRPVSYHVSSQAKSKAEYARTRR